MAINSLKIQRFRKNDLIDDGGKQFELGKSWCSDFFEIDDNLTTATIDLTFKAINVDQEPLDNKSIELKLADVSNRGDRKAYVNSDSGRSQIKDFFINDLKLSDSDNSDDYFAVLKTSGLYYLYVIPNLLYNNFIQLFESLAPNISVQEVNRTSINSNDVDSRQIIYYGAPGTGKSFRIKDKLNALNTPKENIFRTTFHPDSDYSTFVGAYKPTRGKKPLYGLNGSNTVRMHDGEDLSEEIITYKFVAQAFLKAYIRAYEKPDENVYLVIEEINRGNCAQIFGDLFQLLDRDENGKSDYTIKADDDLKNFLEEEFKRIGTGNDGIADGELCLPSNLYIYATMNTSDQSLFPIDSAFKRRWDWEYEPIKYNHDLIISIGDIQYEWTSFQKEVNKRIKDATSSEDKMLGDYFVNPSDGIIDENTLRNKILFYLWNDVCRDGEGDIFKVSETQELTFSDLYGEEGTDNLIAMMEYLGIEEYEEDTDTDVDENEGTLISQGSKSADINKVQFSFNEYKKIADGVGQNINADKLFFRNGIDVAFQGKKLNANPRLCLTMDKSKTRSQAEVKLWIPSIYKKKEELFAFLKNNGAEDIVKSIAKGYDYHEIGKDKSQDKNPVRGWAITIPVDYDASDFDQYVGTISTYLNELKKQFEPLIGKFN